MVVYCNKISIIQTHWKVKLDFEDLNSNLVQSVKIHVQYDDNKVL